MARYATGVAIVLLPLVVVVGHLSAITSDSFARLFAVPASCVHINCIFLLSDTTIYQLFLLGICGMACLAYFVTTLLPPRGSVDAQTGMSRIPYFLASYCLYIQIVRIILAFTFFEYQFQWWMPVVSRIAIFSFVLHACMFFIISFPMVTKKRGNQSALLIFSVLISFSISYVALVDRHLLTEQLLHKIGYLGQLRVFIITLNVITLINYLKHSIETRNKKMLWLQGGYVLHALAMHAMFIPLDITILIVAILCVCLSMIGIAVYTRMTLRSSTAR